jgi:XTP/dITP diphosphohydrolase
VKTFVATKNLGKLAEMREIFAGSPLRLDTFPTYADVAEGDADYTDNARLKARRLFEQLRAAGIRAAVLADDSGLEVAALGGRPGVLSARYGGTDAAWPARRAQLLAEISAQQGDDRAARFVCAMVLLFEDGREIDALGTLDGSIAPQEQGHFGFGYDPIFIPAGANRTLAEYSEREKNAISHRRRAAEALLLHVAAQ